MVSAPASGRNYQICIQPCTGRQNIVFDIKFLVYAVFHILCSLSRIWKERSHTIAVRTLYSQNCVKCRLMQMLPDKACYTGPRADYVVYM